MSRAATSRLKVNPPVGLRPSLENCRIPDLNVDPSYQRSIDNGSSSALIRKIAVYWDWSLFHPLAVARRADESLWVVDGQHRLAAAKLRRDMYDLPCVVTRYASMADEAASFVAMNIQRRALNALDLFNAALAADDDSAIEIMGLLKAAGLTLARHTNHTAWKPRMLANIGGIRESHRRFGPAVTLAALRALAQGFDGQVLRYGGTIFGAIAYFLADEFKRSGEMDMGLFIDVLRGASQREWVSEIEAVKGREGIRRQIAGAQVMQQAYREAIDCDLEEVA